MKRQRRVRWPILLAGLLTIVGVIFVSARSYWRYVNYVPPFAPALPPLPEPNGYTRAAEALAQLPSFAARSSMIPGSRQSAGPTPPSPATNRLRLLSSWPNLPPGQLRAQLTRVRPVLDEVRADFRLEWRTPLVLTFQEDYSDLRRFRQCARCFAAESTLARSQSDYASAMQRSLDAMELGGKLARGSANIPWMAARDCHSTGFEQAERTVNSLPEEAVPAALVRLRRIRKGWPPVREMLENERITRLALATEGFQEYAREPLSRKFDPDYFMHTNPWELAVLAYTPRKTALAHMDHHFRQLIAESKKPVRQRRPVPDPGDIWSQLLADLTLDYPWSREGTLTELGLLEVALAVRMHYFEHGQYPARLAEVPGGWLPSLPVDLWGQPIAYRLKEGKPVVYSLGPDGRDDSGQTIDPQMLSPTTRGDLVFGKLYVRQSPLR